MYKRTNRLENWIQRNEITTIKWLRIIKARIRITKEETLSIKVLTRSIEEWKEMGWGLPSLRESL